MHASSSNVGIAEDGGAASTTSLRRQTAAVDSVLSGGVSV